MAKTFVITLSDDLEQELIAQAKRMNKSPEAVMLEVLSQQLTSNTVPLERPKRNLLRLRGIAKRAGSTLSDTDIIQDYTDYLIQKYQ